MKKFLARTLILLLMGLSSVSAQAYSPGAPVNRIGVGASLSNPVTQAQGGTGGTSAPTALSALGIKVVNLASQGLPTGGDDTTAINVITAAAKTAGVAVYAPCGTYKHAGVITVDSIHFFGDGPCSIFQSTDTTASNPNMAINLKGTAPKLDHIKLTTTWAGARQANLQADAVWVGTLLSSLVTNFEVSDITIDGAAAAGIGPSYAEGGLITRNYISNTKADSVTLQNAYGHTSHVIVSNNNIYNSGDACVSVNSYQSGHANGEATPASDITVTGNICNTAVAVAINVCGGNDVTITGNTIQSPGAEGFYSISGSSFFCQAVNNVTFSDNIITSPNTGGSAIGSIRVEGASGFLNTNTKIHHNTITNAKTSGVRVGAGGAVYVYNAEVTNNVINGAGESGASHQGLAINGANNTLVSGNTISNWDDEGVWTPSSSLNTGYLKLMNNHVDQVNLGAGSTYAYLLDNTGLSELDFIGNTQTNGSSTVTGCWYMTTSTPNINSYANDCENTSVGGSGIKYGAAVAKSGTIYWEPPNDSTAHDSTAGGTGALAGQTAGSAAYQNTAFGHSALGGSLTTAGLRNSAFGRSALANTTTGPDNTAMGVNSAASNTTGSNNVAMGRLSGNQNQTGASNTDIGTFADQGSGNNNHSFNSSLGASALTADTTGGSNSALGYQALGHNTTGASNTGVGLQAGLGNTTGNNSTFLGYQVGATCQTGGSNLILGNDNTSDCSATSTANYGSIGGSGGKITSTNLNSATAAWTFPGTVTDSTGQLVNAAGTGMSKSSGTLNSNATSYLTFQPYYVTAIGSTKGGFAKISKTSTVDNIEASAEQFTCSVNPVITMYECGTSATCASSPTTIGTITLTASGTVVDGTVSSAAITAGDYVAFAVSAGTCTLLNASFTAQVHSN